MRGTVRGALALVVGGVLAAAGAVPALADSTRTAEWYASYLHFSKLHAVSRGAGVTVAVIDTGVDAKHRDLRGSVLPGVDAWSSARDGRSDSDGHGTAMAALIAGHGHGAGGADGVLGIAPEAKILPVGAYPPGSDSFSPDDLAVGIRWAVDHGADVISISIGGGSDPRIESSVSYALAKGVTVVAAAGNKPRNHSLAFPAAYLGVIAVSAVGRSGRFATAVSVKDFGVLLSAPGVDMVSAAPGGGYRTTSGTSDSTALVAGAAALIKAKYPALTGEQIYQRLKATAVDRGPAGYDEEYGYGVIDPYRALTKQVPLMSASASPAPGTPTTASDLGVASDRGTAMKVLLSVLLVAGYAIIAGGIVLLVVRLLRRRAVRSRASTAPPDPPAPGPPAQRAVEDDDSGWRHPVP